MFPSVGLREPQHCGSGQRISLWEHRIVTHKSVRESEHRSVEVRASGPSIGPKASEGRNVGASSLGDWWECPSAYLWKFAASESRTQSIGL